MKLYTFDEIKECQFNNLIVSELKKIEFISSVWDTSQEANWMNVNQKVTTIKSPWSEYEYVYIKNINWDDYLIYSIICGKLYIINKKYYESMKNDRDFLNYLEDEQNKMSLRSI